MEICYPLVCSLLWLPTLLGYSNAEELNPDWHLGVWRRTQTLAILAMKKVIKSYHREIFKMRYCLNIKSCETSQIIHKSVFVDDIYLLLILLLKWKH